MKEHNYHNINSISSFSDFVIERKRLILKKKLIEARLQFNAGELKEIFNLNKDLSLDQIRDFIHNFSGTLERVFKSESRAGTNDTSTGAL